MWTPNQPESCWTLWSQVTSSSFISSTCCRGGHTAMTSTFIISYLSAAVLQVANNTHHHISPFVGTLIATHYWLSSCIQRLLFCRCWFCSTWRAWWCSGCGEGVWTQTTFPSPISQLWVICWGQASWLWVSDCMSWSILPGQFFDMCTHWQQNLSIKKELISKSPGGDDFWLVGINTVLVTGQKNQGGKEHSLYGVSFIMHDI